MTSKVITEFIMKTAGEQDNHEDDDEKEHEDDAEPKMEEDEQSVEVVENFLKQFLINSESSGLMDSIDLRMMLTALH